MVADGEHEAWKHLSGNAVKVYTAIHRRFNGRNNGYIGYGTRDGLAVGLSEPVTRRAIKELIDKGFVKVIKDSSFSQTRLTREFAITAIGVSMDPPTRDFRAFKAGEKLTFRTSKH